MTPLACETPPTGPAAGIAARVASTIPVLETPRLRLRAPLLEDFAEYADIATGPRGRFLWTATRADAWLDYSQMVAGWTLRGHGLWSVEDRQTGDLTGFVLLGFDQEDHEPELGYIFSGAAEGRNLAFEAASRARAFAFDDLRWTTLVSYIDPENTRSIRLAERLGAKRDGRIADADGGTTLVFRHPAGQGGH